VINNECLPFLVSAGFDAADGDDLGECHVTPTGYAHMTHMLSGLAGGKLVVALEVCVLVVH
jgi:histone deacetylase 6